MIRSVRVACGINNEQSVSIKLPTLHVCAAFLRPKGIRANSNRPNGVVIAVLGTSSGATGIW